MLAENLVPDGIIMSLSSHKYGQSNLGDIQIRGPLTVTVHCIDDC